MDLAGHPIVAHIFDRLRATKGVRDVVLATTMDPRNEHLVSYAQSKGIAVFREEDENDIAARLLGAANATLADAILKVNGDCPLVDPVIMRQLVEMFATGEYDYVSNKIIWSWPEGYSAEIISTDALVCCASELTTALDRELVANYIRDNTSRFRVGSVGDRRYNGLLKLAVDTPEDFEEVAGIFSALWPANPLFGFKEVSEFLRGESRRTETVFQKNTIRR